jgi:protoporphyrinogen oxidase
MDIGPHRFFTKNEEVSELWRSVLGDEFKICERITRIYYENIFFNYPLTASEIPFKLGLPRTAMVGLSYLKRHLVPLKPEDDFESWVRNRFGDALYDIFFKEYTTKVWGVDPKKIDAEWAAQRIRSLSLGKVIADMLKISNKKQTSLINSFEYPELGAGQMYEAMAAKIAESGSEFIHDAEVVKISIDSDGETVVSARIAGELCEFRANHVVSSMPLDELALSIDSIDSETSTAAENLSYRSLVSVNLMYDAKPSVSDHWIYLNSGDVKAGRMDLYHNFSATMAPSANSAVIALEYFCDPDDNIWTAPNEQMVDTAVADMTKIDFMNNLKPIDEKVVRYPKAYPCYFGDYKRNLKKVREFLNANSSIIPVGRYGQFRYNNMDHSIATGLLAARKIMGENADPWSVNEDAEYHEEK